MAGKSAPPNARAPSGLRTAWLVARFQMPLRARTRGILPSLLVVLAPVVVATLARLHAATPSPRVFYGIVQGYYLHLGVGALMLGVALGGFPADEASGALAYLLTKPVPRWGIVVGRLVSATVTGCVLTLSSALATGVTLGVSAQTVASAWPALLAGSVHYGVFFSVLTLLTSRPTTLGLLYLFVWEPVLSVLPGAIHSFTASYYLRALLPAEAQPTPVDLPFFSFLHQRPPHLEACLRLAATAGAMAIVGVVAFRRRDYSPSPRADEGA